MHTYSPKKFNLPQLPGLSAKQIEIHLKLYEGYVKHVNLLREKLAEMNREQDKNAFAISELRRRFAFEFCGMRMHEFYFEQLESRGAELEEEGLKKVLEEKYGSMENFRAHFEEVALSRGVGWSVLYYDPIGKTPHTSFVGDHELGQLSGLPIILALDMWEHAFMVDYVPADKKKYIEAFWKNLNFSVCAQRFEKARLAV